MSYTSFDPNTSTGGPKSEEKYREWELQPQNEYRFELAQNTSIGIKVSSRRGVNMRLNPLRRRVSVGGWVCRVLWNRTRGRDIVHVRGRV